MDFKHLVEAEALCAILVAGRPIHRSMLTRSVIFCLAVMTEVSLTYVRDFLPHAKARVLVHQFVWSAGGTPAAAAVLTRLE